MKPSTKVLIGVLGMIATVRLSIAITALFACGLGWTTEFLGLAWEQGNRGLLLAFIIFLLWDNDRLTRRLAFWESDAMAKLTRVQSERLARIREKS